jgi:hypothetical protein
MIPLASDLLPFPDQMRRGGHLMSASRQTDFLHLAALRLWAPFLGTVERYSRSLWIKSPGVASGSQNARAATGFGNTALEAMGLSVNRRPSRATATTWISIRIPGWAKLDTVRSRLRPQYLMDGRHRVMQFALPVKAAAWRNMHYGWRWEGAVFIDLLRSVSSRESNLP